MDLDIIRNVLGWSAVINFAISIVWFLVYWLAHDWIVGIYKKWFNLPTEKLDSIIFTLMGMYQLMIILLFVGPYLAIRIVT